MTLPSLVTFLKRFVVIYLSLHLIFSSLSSIMILPQMFSSSIYKQQLSCRILSKSKVHTSNVALPYTYFISSKSHFFYTTLLQFRLLFAQQIYAELSLKSSTGLATSLSINLLFSLLSQSCKEIFFLFWIFKPLKIYILMGNPTD